jgi:glycosyltransferase involved in cell wall biosynthesis
MQNNIKLCYILPDYNPKTDSHFYHLYEFLEKLSEKIDIFLIIERSNVDFKEIKIGNAEIYVQKFKFIPLRILENLILVLKARKRGYELFYTHYGYIGATNAGIVTRLFGGKSYYWNCAMNWLFQKKDISKIGYKLSLNLSHYLVTGGETMKQGYVEHYKLKPEKVKILPNCINLNRFYKSSVSNERSDPATSKTFLFVHWLSKRKGADMIVFIAKHLSQILNIKYKIFVVGDGPYKEQLSKEIKENNLENYIEIIGAVPNEKIIDYYKQADIFIMPSMEEGFPRVLLEAMAMGVPYVAFDVGAVRELSPETAQRFLVKSGDVELFAHKIESLLNDKDTYKTFQKEELEKIKEYSMDSVMDKFINILSESTN